MAHWLLLEKQEAKEAGGFLTTADDIVQPYSLPRNLHEVLPESNAPDKPADHPVPEATIDDTPRNANTIAMAAPALSLETFDISDDAEDEPLEEVPMPMPMPNGTSGAVPMSLQEFAEAAEKAREDLQEDVADEVPGTVPEPETTMVVSRTRGRSTRSNTSTPAGPKTGLANGKGNAKRPAPRRGRKRMRGESPTESESESLSEPEPAKAAPAKRARTAKAPAPPAVKSDRVLRSRKSKSEAKLVEEREQEEAYRRAVAE